LGVKSTDAANLLTFRNASIILDNMEKNNARDAFAPLGQSTRLDVFRLLIKAGRAGIPYGGLLRRPPE
jgi:hypothetical protein